MLQILTQKSTAYDLGEIKEQQEMADVISEVNQNTITLTLKPKLDEAEQQKAQAKQVLKAEPTNTQAKQALEQANQTIIQYGKGGDVQMAMRAVTGVLQGLATKNTNGAIASSLSPYANKLIKEQTKGNPTANLMAHAVLGAIEAKATGNNALAGATGAVSAEMTAKLITEKLYNKPVTELTEQEKETVSTLSQIAGGLAGGAVGGSEKDAIESAEIGKRAVDNNLLSVKNDSLVFDLSEKLDKKGGLLSKERLMVTQKLYLDEYTDMLNKKRQAHLKDPKAEPLTPKEEQYLENAFREIAFSDTISGFPKTIDDLYNYDYKASKIGRDESNLKKYLMKMDNYEQDPVTRIAEGVGQGAFLLTNPEGGVVKGFQVTKSIINKGINLAKKHPKATEVFITGSIGTANDIYNGEFSPERTFLHYGTAAVQAGRPVSERLSIGLGTTLVLSANDPNKSDKEILGDLIGNFAGIQSGNLGGVILSKTKLPTPAQQVFSEILSNETENKVKETIIKGK